MIFLETYLTIQFLASSIIFSIRSSGKGPSWRTSTSLLVHVWKPLLYTTVKWGKSRLNAVINGREWSNKHVPFGYRILWIKTTRSNGFDRINSRSADCRAGCCACSCRCSARSRSFQIGKGPFRITFTFDQVVKTRVTRIKIGELGFEISRTSLWNGRLNN